MKCRRVTPITLITLLSLFLTGCYETTSVTEQERLVIDIDEGNKGTPPSS